MKFFNKILVLFLSGMLLITGGHLYAQEPVDTDWIQEAKQVGIDQSVLAEVQNRVQNGKISSEQLEFVMQTAIAMSEEDLPAEVAIQKALEGFSKGIPGGRIASVVQKVHSSASQAARVVDPWLQRPGVEQMAARSEGSMSRDRFRTELVKATSKSFMQDLPSNSVTNIFSQIENESILSNAGPSDIVAAMGILPDLPQVAQNVESSGKFVVQALKEGFGANDLQKLPSAIKIAQERSQLPAASVVEGVVGQMQGNVPAKQILNNLFNGNVGGGPPGNIPRGLDKKPNRGQNGKGKGKGPPGQ